LKGVIEFGDKDKTIKFNETLETAERLAGGKKNISRRSVES
jgi:hypothetical protein